MDDDDYRAEFEALYDEDVVCGTDHVPESEGMRYGEDDYRQQQQSERQITSGDSADISDFEMLWGCIVVMIIFGVIGIVVYVIFSS